MAEMRLSHLTISNFQYWEWLELDLVAEGHDRPFGAVVIFGPQGSGKSTIARALRWLAYGDLGRGADQSYPASWRGVAADDQVVRGKFLRKGPQGQEQTVILERRRNREERASRLLVEIVGPEGGSLDGPDAEEVWSTYVGQRPRAHEGAIWMVRRDEMERIHQSLSDAEGQSYLLQFFNQSEILERFDVAISELEDEFTQMLDTARREESLVSQYKDLRERGDAASEELEGWKKKREEADALLARNQLSESEKKLLNAGELFAGLKTTEALAKSDLAGSHLGRTGLSQVVNASLASVLVRAGHRSAIPKDTLADEFDWDYLLERLEGKISDDSTFVLRQIAAEKRGLDLRQLRLALPVMDDALERVQAVRKAMKALVDVKTDLKAFEGHGITTQAFRNLNLKNDIFEAALSEVGTAGVKMEKAGETLAEITALKAEKEAELNESVAASEGISACGKALSVAKQLRNTLVAAESDYRRDMFAAAISRLRDFWTETSTSDVFMPALSSDNQSIVLKKRDSGEEFRILLEDQGQGPSSGESEQLLVCMALAVANQARVQMPLVLDDVHTRMDNHTRPAVFEIATGFTHQIIFVTNDTNKLDEMRPYVDAVIEMRKASLAELPAHSAQTALVTVRELEA